jgi:hypothetical protein
MSSHVSVSHSVHHVLAIWAMGASGETIKGAYKANEDFLLDPVAPPEEITEKNFDEHLADRK